MKLRRTVSLNRRTFLATASGLALATSRCYGAPLPQVGLIGLGEVGARLLRTAAAQSLPLHIAAVADTSARSFDGIPASIRRTTDWETLVNDARLDAVLIATPDHLHPPMARATLDAGKHVYLVPPLAHASDQADTLFHAAARATGQLYVARDRRATAHWMQYRDALMASRTGSPRWIQADIPVPSTRPGEHWSHRRDHGLGDAACALYSSLYALMDTFELDRPARRTLLGGVFAKDGRETPDALTFSAEFESGLRVTLTARAGDATPRLTTLHSQEKTFELSSHPGDCEFDLAEWATQLHNNRNDVERHLHIAENTQFALSEALDRNLNIRENA